jgi:hypothetical protein
MCTLKKKTGIKRAPKLVSPDFRYQLTLESLITTNTVLHVLLPTADKVNSIYRILTLPQSCIFRDCMPNLFFFNQTWGKKELLKPLLTTDEKLLAVKLLYLMEILHLATLNAPSATGGYKK